MSGLRKAEELADEVLLGAGRAFQTPVGLKDTPCRAGQRASNETSLVSRFALVQVTKAKYCIQYAVSVTQVELMIYLMRKSLDFKTLAPNVSLSDLVHQRIVEALVTGQFKGGEELNEVSLAAQFRVSRTPVREALRRLAAEGLVVNQRNRQTTVIQMSRQDVIETYQVRQILEASAARMAATQIDDQRLVELRSLAAAATPTKPGDWGGGERKFDDELHKAIAESCGNGKLLREIQRYQNLIRFVRARIARLPQRLAIGHSEHLKILDALERHDPERAEEEMSAHIASAMHFVLEDLTATGGA